MKFQIFVFACAVACAYAHLCMISPPQRGSMMGLNTKGSKDCAIEKGPCGDRKPRGPALRLAEGSNFTVTFQKNLDHFLEKTPGHFEIALLHEKEEIVLGKIDDRGEPSLHLYSKNVTMPRNHTGTPFTLRTTYVTMNHDAPPVFYQCSEMIELYSPK